MYELPATATVYLSAPRSRAIDTAGDSTSSSRLVLREKGSAFLHKQARCPSDPPRPMEARSC